LWKGSNRPDAAMKRQNHYYTLMASLPPLPRFDRAERLPINSVRLAERLRMLQPEDAEVVEHAAAFLTWRHQPAKRTDQEIANNYTQLIRHVKDVSLRAIIEFPTNLKAILAALRRKHLGFAAPVRGETWGVGPLVGHMMRNWDDPNFKLMHLYPWIPQAREYLETGEALALEKLLFRLEWDSLARLSQGMEFGFDAVLAYLFQWDIVERWLSYDSKLASSRFEGLLAEVIEGHERIFA